MVIIAEAEARLPDLTELFAECRERVRALEAEVNTYPGRERAARERLDGLRAVAAALPLPAPLARTFEDTFPQVGPWYGVVTVTGCMTAKEAGACAAWQAVAALAVAPVSP